MDLSKKSCVPCRGGVPPLSPQESKTYLAELSGWEVVQNHHLVKTYPFPEFRSGLGFVNRVGELAEKEGHHPNIYLGYSEVRLEIWTHKIDGLTESDFILAAKADKIYKV